MHIGELIGCADFCFEKFLWQHLHHGAMAAILWLSCHIRISKMLAGSKELETLGRRFLIYFAFIVLFLQGSLTGVYDSSPFIPQNDFDLALAERMTGHDHPSKLYG